VIVVSDGAADWMLAASHMPGGLGFVAATVSKLDTAIAANQFSEAILSIFLS
jgi:hypothetical protein